VTITVGGTPQGSDPLGNPWMYTGRFTDEETGLYYYRARYYSPETGRFLERDPFGYGPGSNVYAYATSNPTTNMDPFGLRTRDPRVQRVIDARAAVNAAYNAVKAAEAALKAAQRAQKELDDLQNRFWARGNSCSFDSRRAWDLIKAIMDAERELTLTGSPADAQAALDAAQRSLEAAQAAARDAREDLRSSGLRPGRDDILEMAKQDILAFGKPWSHNAMENGDLKHVPRAELHKDESGRPRQGEYDPEQPNAMFVANEEIDAAWHHWERSWGESDLVAILLHEARHWAEWNEDAYRGSEPHPADAQRPPQQGGVGSGRPAWRHSDGPAALEIERQAHAAQGR
jgi:RHS repeat-associated protein